MLRVTNDVQVPLAEMQGATAHGDSWVGDNVFPEAPLSPAPDSPIGERIGSVHVHKQVELFTQETPEPWR